MRSLRCSGRIAAVAFFLFVLQACSGSSGGSGGGGGGENPPPLPGAPVGVEAFPGSGSALVSWVGSGTSFNVYYGPTSALTTASAKIASPTFGALVPGLANGSPTWFAVSAVNSTGEGPLSTPTCAVPTTAQTSGLQLHDALCAALPDGMKWHAPGWYSFGVTGGHAWLGVDVDHQAPRGVRNDYNNAQVSVNAGPQRVTTLAATLTVPAATLLRTGDVHVRAAVRLQYEPPAHRLNFPAQAQDDLLLEVGLVDTGTGLQAYRGVWHCDDASCATVSTSNVAFVDPPGISDIAGTTFRGAPASLDTAYTMTASLDEATGIFHWTIAGGSFGAGISGTADPSAYLAATAAWAGSPLAGSGFWNAQLLARTQDVSPAGGGRGKIVALVDDVRVGFNNGAAAPFDDFSGTGANSGPAELSLANWTAGGACEMVPSGGSLQLHQQATSTGAQASFGHGVRMTAPAAVNGLQADVKVVAWSGASPTGSNVAVQGRFYNDGSPGGQQFSALGDVLASVALQPITNTATWWVGRCANATCGGALTPFVSGAFPGVIVGSGVHSLHVKWNPGPQTFTLSVDGATHTVNAADVAPAAGPPNAPLAWVFTSLGLPPAAGTAGSVTAKVNNVFVDVAPKTCNALDPSTAPALTSASRAAANAPAPTGGTIAVGTYDLTAVNLYTGAGGASGSVPLSIRQVLVIDGAAIQRAEVEDTQQGSHTYSYAVAGADLVTTGTCGDLGTSHNAFTASGASLKIYFADVCGAAVCIREAVFTKR